MAQLPIMFIRRPSPSGQASGACESLLRKVLVSHVERLFANNFWVFAKISRMFESTFRMLVHIFKVFVEAVFVKTMCLKHF